MTTAQPPRAAYVHVPFCIHRCGYCDFTVITNRDDLIDVYLQCLERELRSTLQNPKPVETLFVGGGTPSYLNAQQLKRLLKLLREWLPLEQSGEFSIECNPEQFTSDRMEVMQQAGVNRISLGVQSLDEQHLRILERSHNAGDVESVVDRLLKFGLSNVAIDLIFAVPNQALADWKRTLQRVVEFPIKHVSTYGLTWEKGTAYWTRRMKEQLRPVGEEEERSMYEVAMEFLPDQGFEQYELSNFAKAGFASRHNQVYWRGEPYWGFGPGAASYIDGVRATNHRSVTQWIKLTESGQSPIQSTEKLNSEDHAREAVMLGLRQVVGISIEEFHQRYGHELRELAPAAWQMLLDEQLLEETGSHVRLTQKGRFVADSVMSEFL